MKITLLKNVEEKETLDFKGKTLNDLFKQLNFWEENTVVVKNERIILKDEKLQNNDKLIIYSTASRG